MTKIEVLNNYFDWMVNLVCGQRYAKHISYEKLLATLHNTEFRWSISNDANRASDGVKLRRRYALSVGDEEYYDDICNHLSGPCSVLEMMIALAIRCEENIMDDPLVGDRTGQWFWGMIVNLGLGGMADTRFDEGLVEGILNRFLDRKYEPDGRYGLFRIHNCHRDLRDVEIWIQLLWYLDSIG